MYGFIIITTSFKNIKGKITKKDMMCSIKINIDKKETYIKAIIDTGNFLREPITKLPVIVVQKDSLINLIPEDILNNLEKIINGEDINLGEYISKVRIIPFTSLGKENGILLGIKSDKILIDTEEKTVVAENVIVGIYNGVLGKNGKYQALIGLEMIEDSQGGKEYEHIRNIEV